jgi:hypothetical protein
MEWGPVRDRIVEGRAGQDKVWLLLNHKEKVLGIYLKITEVSKFVPADQFEETLDGAKLRAEIELERFYTAQKIGLIKTQG